MRVVRRNALSRLLPPIGLDLLVADDGAGTPADAGRRLLALAKLPARWPQRVTGFGLLGVAKIGRVLLLHRFAFAAESAGQLRRADFFWREAHAALRRAWPDTALWDAARLAVGDGAPATADALRRCIGDELFFDAHAGFANARLAQSDALPIGDRAFAHLEYLRALLTLQQASPSYEAEVLAPLHIAQITAYKQAKRWDDAITQSGALCAMNRTDRRLLTSLAMLHFEAAIDRLDGTDDAHAAQILAGTIEQVEALRRSQPDVPLLYDLLGQVHHLHAVRLANSGQLSTALVAARRAQVFTPGMSGSTETMSTLVDNMRKLQKQMQEFEARLRESPNLRLNAQGIKARSEAREGFAPLQRYVDSGEPETIGAERRLAHARTLWEDAGLPPDPKPSAEQVLELLDAAGELYASDVTSADELAASFRARAAGNAGLAGIDADSIATFVIRRRRENGSDALPSEAPAPARTDVGPADAPLVAAAAAATGRDIEPFAYWLFGTQDTGTRLFGAVAALAFVATLCLTVVDAWGTSQRARSYATIVDAVAHDDDRTVVTEAPRFLRVWTLQHGDSRYMNVRELWRDALEAPNRRTRDAATHDLEAAVARGDHAGAIDAAERFLGATPVAVPDPRQPVVAELYAREFSRWFVDLPDSLDDAAQAHISAYKQLAATAGGSQP
jgi:hypothetical protein